MEQDFWESHILPQIPPPYIEEGELVIESARRHFGRADPNAPEVAFNTATENRVLRYLELQEQKALAESSIKALDNEVQRMKGLIIAEMGTCCTAAVSVGTAKTLTESQSSVDQGSRKNIFNFFKKGHFLLQ